MTSCGCSKREEMSERGRQTERELSLCVSHTDAEGELSSLYTALSSRLTLG